MTDSTSIEQPFPIFFNKVGKPLDSGYVYIGEYGKNPQTNPIQAFWDEALTQPAVQPIRTINGYYSRYGTPSRVFIQGISCSITVRDKYQTVVYSELKTSGKVAGLINASVILDDSGLTQQQWNNGIESIADLMAITSPKNNNRQFVKSYYVDENKGGDNFYFDSTKAAINNGVTIFNGWVRDLSDRILTTDDAGLKEDGSNATVRFQALAEAVGDNFTFKIIGKHLVTTNIEFNNTTNLRITGEGEVSAKELRDQFVFLRPVNAIRGIFYFNNCPYLTITDNVTLTGCKKHNMNSGEPWQDGDSPVQLNNCPHSLIEYNVLRNSITWGVYGVNSSYTIVQKNEIYDIVRQSGVNIFVGGSNGCKVKGNNIHDIGLYGIELETNFDKFINDCEVSGNVVTDVQKGCSLVRNIIHAKIHDNTFTFCYNGVLAYPLLDSSIAVKNVEIYDNTALGCVLGFTAAQSNNINFDNNTASMRIANDFYFHTTSYNSIVEKLSDTTFYVFPMSDIVVGNQVKINDVLTSVTNREVINDNRYLTGTLIKVTVGDSIASAQQHDFVKTLVPYGSGYRGLFSGGSNQKIVFKNNTVIAYYNGIQSDSSYTTNTDQEVFINNTIIDCDRWLSLPLDTRLLVAKTNIINSGTFSIATFNTIATSVVPKFITSITNPIARASGGAYPVSNFNMQRQEKTMLIQLTFDPSMSTTGNIAVFLDDVEIVRFLKSDIGDSKSMTAYLNLDISNGLRNIRLADTIGDLAFKAYQFDFYFV